MGLANLGYFGPTWLLQSAACFLSSALLKILLVAVGSIRGIPCSTRKVHFRKSMNQLAMLRSHGISLGDVFISLTFEEHHLKDFLFVAKWAAQAPSIAGVLKDVRSS